MIPMETKIKIAQNRMTFSLSLHVHPLPFPQSFLPGTQVQYLHSDMSVVCISIGC